MAVLPSKELIKRVGSPAQRSQCNATANAAFSTPCPLTAHLPRPPALPPACAANRRRSTMAARSGRSLLMTVMIRILERSGPRRGRRAAAVGSGEVRAPPTGVQAGAVKRAGCSICICTDDQKFLPPIGQLSAGRKSKARAAEQPAQPAAAAAAPAAGAPVAATDGQAQPQPAAPLDGAEPAAGASAPASAAAAEDAAAGVAAAEAGAGPGTAAGGDELSITGRKKRKDTGAAAAAACLAYSSQNPDWSEYEQQL